MEHESCVAIELFVVKRQAKKRAAAAAAGAHCFRWKQNARFCAGFDYYACVLTSVALLPSDSRASQVS
jgi:hypothetical protein